MRFIAVTTFNAAGLELYGRRMIETYLRHWPREVPLYAYSEGWGPGSAPPGVFVRDLNSSSPWLLEFKARNGRRHPGGGFRFDAVRFSHKVAALAHAVSLAEAEVVIWVDGDIVTHSPISIPDLACLAPAGEEWIAWLNRKHMYPECGFYMLNCQHPRHREAMAHFERMYTHDRLYELAEWHDSFVLAETVRQLGLSWKSLSGSHARTGHPLVNGPLGRWMDHLKGARKSAGRSHVADLVAERKEPYWSGKT